MYMTGCMVGREKSRCKDCEKDVFWSFVGAMRYALGVKRRKSVEIRVYRCPRKRGWHVTSSQHWEESGGRV